jgi:putative ABC transport system ATP-binding protein
MRRPGCGGLAELMQISSSDLGLAARVQHVSKIFGAAARGTSVSESDGAVHALDDVSIGIRRGEFTAIMGPSGSGKSTLMHVMAGLDAASSGRAWIGDTEITGLGDLELTVLRRRRVGFVFQAFNLVPTLDAISNILLPFDLDGRRPSAMERARVDGLVERLGLAARLHHRPHQLSGGQQQRVAIARALATAPDLVFADEPTGNLDSRTGREVLALLAAASRDHGQSIAMVTHDPVAAAAADRVLFLGDGRIVADKPRQTAEQIAAYMLRAETGGAAEVGEVGGVGAAATDATQTQVSA